VADNAINVEPFDQATFAQLLIAASGGTVSGEVPFQVEYLARYCARLGVVTVITEQCYIDRHFTEEYALYYSRMLTPPRNNVQRFHLFTAKIEEPDLVSLLDLGTSSIAGLNEALSRVQPHYRGFISVRPIASAPVGRSVLTRIADSPEDSRHIWATSEHEVHVANLNLKVDGLAFQQQDVAVGACATAALWSALSRVARFEGMRAPTPAEVSEAASRHFLPYGRSLPAASGLAVEQLSEAIRACGFAPEVVTADTAPEIFALALHTYLLSGIPVVLSLYGNGGGHAVTAVGFQKSGTSHPTLEASVPSRSARLKKLYVHDDRIGPYARAFIEPFTHKELGEGLLFKIEDETWLIDSAVVPVYPKLRLSVRSLITLGEMTVEVMEAIVAADEAVNLNVEFQYERGGDYLANLAGRTVAASSASFLRQVSLSRWCGIVRWYFGDSQIAEFVYDTTDIVRLREEKGGTLLKAIVCLDRKFSARLLTVAQAFDVPFLG
jgi:hypothetical protein